jgi:hypothetical protein
VKTLQRTLPDGPDGPGGPGGTDPTWRRALGALAAVPVLALALTACNGDATSAPVTPGAVSSGTGDPGDTGGPAGQKQTRAHLGRVEGRLPQGKRQQVREQVTQAVDAWFDAAYVGGDYPRSDFSTSWPGFTPGAAADARSDKRLMSNVSLGPDIAGVEATARRVDIDVLAVKGHARGATARFVLKFKTSGDVQRKVQISGRLFLTPGSHGGWKIFGYDVTKGRGV